MSAEFPPVFLLARETFLAIPYDMATIATTSTTTTAAVIHPIGFHQFVNVIAASAASKPVGSE